MAVIAGFDPGFEYVGYALVDFTSEGRKILALGTVHTVKSGRKGSVRQASDMIRRSQAVWGEIRGQWLNKPAAICCETPPSLRNSTVRAQIAFVCGGLALYADILKVPLLETTPNEVKMAACGKASATKEEIIEAMERKYPGVVWPVTVARGTKSTAIASHAADALASIEACLCDPVVRALGVRV